MAIAFTLTWLKYLCCCFSCSGLQKYLNQLGFHIVGYGCTTCIGNSGDIDEAVASAITENGIYLFVSGYFLCIHLGIWGYLNIDFLNIPDIVAAAVLSGNRNFEGRVHPLTRANYLASPPLVVAYALAGTVCVLGIESKHAFNSKLGLAF